ncbi:MAG: hypothetical protein ABR602_04950 [Gemmatimonadales bacterium]
MRDTQLPFDAQPDEELGALLRAGLDGPAPEAFTSRLRSAVVEAERAESWEVLAGWARPGLVAAGLAAAAVLWVVLTRDVGPPMGAQTIFVQELIAGQPATSEVLISAVLGGR